MQACAVELCVGERKGERLCVRARVCVRERCESGERERESERGTQSDSFSNRA